MLKVYILKDNFNSLYKYDFFFKYEPQIQRLSAYIRIFKFYNKYNYTFPNLTLKRLVIPILFF